MGLTRSVAHDLGYIVLRFWGCLSLESLFRLSVGSKLSLGSLSESCTYTGRLRYGFRSLARTAKAYSDAKSVGRL